MAAFRTLSKTDRSLRHRVAEILREAIITAELKPGERLLEEEISQQLGVSRGPVREALRQLEQEGLVISFPYRGCEVVGVSEAEVREVLVPIRLILERVAFRHALPRLTEEDLAELDRLVHSMREAGESGDLDRVVEADVRFHELVLDRSGQTHCAQVWRTISPRVRAYFYRRGSRHRHLSDVADQHQKLLAAMCARDLEQVLALVEEHIVDTSLPLGDPEHG